MTRLSSICVGVVVTTMVACASEGSDDEATAAACDRQCLIDLGHGVALGTRPLEAGARITENGAETPLANSWLERAQQVNIHGEYVAAQDGTVIVIGTGNDGDGRPTVFGVRLLHTGGRTTEAELIVTHEGEASLFPTSLPIERRSVFSEIVPEAARMPRGRMIELANAYFDGIEVDSGANVPVTDDCNRVENGVQTTMIERFSNAKCNTLEGFDYITEVRERRFPVVDEERGVVVAHVAFYIPGGDYPRVMNGMMTTRHYDPRALFLIEAFKVEGGKVRSIEATMRNMPLGSTLGWKVP